MKEVNIDYSIISRGTEKYTNQGYMAISEIIDSYRYIMNINHNVKKGSLNNNCLKAKACYSIENIVFSRFQLITALAFERFKNIINDNILILGMGNLGISCLIYLLDNEFKSITIYVREKNNRILELLRLIKKEYRVNVTIITDINLICEKKFNTFIDTTGDSFVLKDIFNYSIYNSLIIILSTPRDEKYLISPLTINRKNLIVVGGHEINGISKVNRQKSYEQLLYNNKNKDYLKKFVNVHSYSELNLRKIKNSKSNFIDMFKY